MTASKPDTAELAEQVVAAQAHLAGACEHLEGVRDELATLAERMPSLPLMCDVDMVLADIRTNAVYLRHAVYLLGAAS